MGHRKSANASKPIGTARNRMHPLKPRLALVLHGHLPFVRHPEHPEFYEETWLFEAVAECYLPLLLRMRQWTTDGIPWRLTLTVSPTLGAMLSDPLLQARFKRWLQGRVALAESECRRGLVSPELRRLAEHYRRHFESLLGYWEEIRGDVIGQWSGHQESGHLEILTCAATHGLLPVLMRTPGAVEGQLQTAVREYHRLFHRAPRGIWLPECAYDPGIEPALRQAGLGWFVLETHGVLKGRPSPPEGLFAPVRTPGGLAAFGRDPASARQVWSRHGGYPGDPRYREFHRDLSDDVEWEYLRPYLPGTAERVGTSIKYHRVTGGDGGKAWYDPELVRVAVLEHAAHFVKERQRHLAAAAQWMSEPPLLVAPYDAELFGHWWYEGPDFLDAVVRRACEDDSGLVLQTLRGVIEIGRPLAVSQPMPSTWGEGGHLGVWLDPVNAWIQDALQRVERRWNKVLKRVAEQGMPADPDACEGLKQAARELLLAQASDWPFLIKMGTAVTYAENRFRTHLTRLEQLLDMVDGYRPMDHAFLQEIQHKDTLFPDIRIEDFCVASTSRCPPPSGFSAS